MSVERSTGPAPGPRGESRLSVGQSKLRQERARGRAGDGTEIGDEVGLVVVARGDRNRGPIGLVRGARGTQRALEAPQSCVRLRAHADGVSEGPTEVPLAQPELLGDDRDGLVFQLLGGGGHDLGVGVQPTRALDAVGDRLPQDRRATGVARVAGVREPLDQPSRLARAPEVGELGVDAVVHCAAFFRGATPEEAHAVNELGTRRLADAARAASVRRFVFTSTGLVYGPKSGELAGEDNLCAPVDAYPASKLAAERLLLAEDDLDVRVLRLPFVYGAGDPHIAEAAQFMRGFSPTQRLAIGHHADVAQAVTLVLDAPSPAHRVYNVVDNEAPDLATLFAAVGEPPPDGSQAERARAFGVLPDGRRIREELGFQPRYPRLADAIAAGAL